MINLYFLLIIVLAVIIALGYFWKYFKEQYKRKEAEKQLDDLQSQNDFLTRRVRSLERDLYICREEAKLKSQKIVKEIPKGTIEAVRYAMLHNHPDNGGDAEKFILYKKCYDKLTNKIQ